MDQRKNGKLTARELEVLLAASKDMDSTVTGEFLGIAPATVRVHRQNAIRKLGMHTISGAVSVALRKRWIR